MIILDTCILIDLDCITLDSTQQYGASILSRAELEFGIRCAPNPLVHAQRVAHLATLDIAFDWLPFDEDCTRAYGEIAAGARTRDAKVRSKDALIAAQAFRFGAAVMTANIDDFSPFNQQITITKPPKAS